jgi:hypothetical protein
MIRSVRRAALLAAVATLIVGAAPTSAQPLQMGTQQPTLSAGQLNGRLGVVPQPCVDSAYHLIGAKWPNGTFNWSFKARSVPRSVGRRAARDTIIKAFHNITSERNDCGRAPRISISANFLGNTGRNVNCNSRDGHNVIGFGWLPRGILAVTCYWTRNGKMVEADMKINKREAWALSLSGCRNQVMLEATITHEAGHVFGLAHVSERKHGRLTMSPYIDGLCENNEATLGLGDMLGLEALYH